MIYAAICELSFGMRFVDRNYVVSHDSLNVLTVKVQANVMEMIVFPWVYFCAFLVLLLGFVITDYFFVWFYCKSTRESGKVYPPLQRILRGQRVYETAHIYIYIYIFDVLKAWDYVQTICNSEQLQI